MPTVSEMAHAVIIKLLRLMIETEASAQSSAQLPYKWARDLSQLPASKSFSFQPFGNFSARRFANCETMGGFCDCGCNIFVNLNIPLRDCRRREQWLLRPAVQTGGSDLTICARRILLLFWMSGADASWSIGYFRRCPVVLSVYCSVVVAKDNVPLCEQSDKRSSDHWSYAQRHISAKYGAPIAHSSSTMVAL